jgi:hypothetical protein
VWGEIISGRDSSIQNKASHLPTSIASPPPPKMVCDMEEKFNKYLLGVIFRKRPLWVKKIQNFMLISDMKELFRKKYRKKIIPKKCFLKKVNGHEGKD